MLSALTSAVTGKSGDVLWTFPAGPGSSGPGGSTPDLCEANFGIDNAGPVLDDTGGGGVYFTSEHTGWRVYALDAATGAERWNVTTADTTSATAPAVAGGSVFFGALRGGAVRLVSVNATTGAPRWDVAAPGKGVAAPPTVPGDGSLLYITLDDGLHAFDTATGAAVWSDTGKLTGCGNTAPQLDAAVGVLYAAGGRSVNGVQALDAKTGAHIWSALPQVDNPWASPVLGGKQLFTAGFVYTGTESYYTGVAYGLDAATGALAWQQNLTTLDQYAYAPQTPAVADGRLFFGGATPTLFALDAATGKLDWQAARVCQGHLWMVPAVAGGTVYTGCDAGQLFAFDAATGAKRWTYAASGAVRSPVVKNGKIYVGVDAQPHDKGDHDSLVVLEA